MTDGLFAPDGSLLFVTGIDLGAPLRHNTVAFDAASGEPVWLTDSPCFSHLDAALARSPDGQRLYRAGACSSPWRWTTEAYDAATGRSLWEVRVDRGPPAPGAIGTSPDGGTVYIAGTHGNRGLTVIAFDAATGTKRWESLRPGSAGRSPQTMAVDPSGERLFVAGETEYPEDPALLTVALDAATGTELWAASVGSGGTPGPGALVVDALGEQVYMIGKTVPGPSPVEVVEVVAYEAASGSETWSRHFSTGSRQKFLPFTRGALVLSPDGSRLFATWHDFGDGAVTIALETTAGETVWEDRFIQGYPNIGATITPDGENLYVGGPAVGGDHLIRGLTAGDGSIRWLARFDKVKGPNDLIPFGGVGNPRLLALSPDGNRLAVLGWRDSSFEPRPWVIVMYEPEEALVRR